MSGKQRQVWQQAFLSNTTRIGFNLVLTQPMMEMLCALSEDLEWDRDFVHSILIPCNFLATWEALTRRGLVERKTEAEINEIFAKSKRERMRVTPFVRLTPAGCAVVEMLKIGGLFIEAKIAKDKLSKRKRA